jgi:hypothetical protein
MKKALKITGIVLASLLALVLLVSGISVALIGSSGQLTKMVKNYAPQFVDCEMQLDKADLTIFKTFPNIGIEIENVTLINPMAGSPSDTLTNIGNLILVIDVQKFRKEDEIVVRKCILEDAYFNLFIDSTGLNNFNVFRTTEDNDSTRFDYLVDIESVRLKNTSLRHQDDRTQTTSRAKSINLNLKGKLQGEDLVTELTLDAKEVEWRDKTSQLALKTTNLGFNGSVSQWDQVKGKLELHTPDIFLNLKEPYLRHDTLSLNLPLQLGLSNKKLHLNPAEIGLNRYLIYTSGDVEICENGDIDLNLSLNTNNLIIEDVLSYLPEEVQQSLAPITYTGQLTVTEAEVKGTYNDSLWPKISAQISTNDAMVNIPNLQHPFTAVNLDAVLDLDLSEDFGCVEINHLSTNFNHSRLNAKGRVEDLLGNIALKLNINGEVPMTDVNSFLPDTMSLSGHSKIALKTNFTVKQLMASLDDHDLKRLPAKAQLAIKDFAFEMDSLLITAPLLNLETTTPAMAKQEGQHGVHVTLRSEQLDVQMGKHANARFGNPDIELFADNFDGSIGKMDLNTKLKFSELTIDHDTVMVKTESSTITVATLPVTEEDGMNAHITFDGKALEAKTGKAYSLSVHSLKIDGTVSRNKAKTDFLSQWSPHSNLTLDHGVARIHGIDKDILVNNIDLLFNPHELDLRKSSFRIGQSDISLQGHIVGILEWSEDHKNLMKGNLQLTSDFLNLNEIMDLTSGLGRSDALTANPENEEDQPFMVPEGVDFTFDIKAKKALFDNFDLNHLNGGLTVKDGTLILQEIGFTNKAAEMLLTAMYQSPRKNNLILAMDFHLLNVQINDLLHMLPYVDTLVPMLRTFDGQAEIHIGAETNLRSNFQPKISTLRAAADIEGKNLSVKDQFTFNNIAEKLKISTNGEYSVDSLNVQLTAFKDEIDLWPSQVAIGPYKVTVDGRMTLDKNGEYHLTVTETPVFLPNRMGLKLSGPINNLDYELEKPKFPTLYKPNRRNDLEQMYSDLKQRISDCMKENLR